MKIEGTREFRAPREAVFEALTDPELFVRSMPGLETYEIRGPDRGTATMKVAVAPRVKVDFEIREKRPPTHACLHAHGKNFGGRIAIDTSFDLEERAGRTTMRFRAEFSLGGLLGRLGEPVLRPLADHQVDKLAQAVERRVARADKAA